MSPPVGTVFDPDAIAVLTAAYEKAVRERAGSLHETIAQRIIELASEGERDPDRLCHGALALSMRADDPERLRARAVQLFAMTLLDIEQEYADKLVAEAVELQERAAAIEEVSRVSASPEAPRHPTQLQEHVDPKDDDEWTASGRPSHLEPRAVRYQA